MSNAKEAAVKAVKSSEQPDTHELSTGYTVRFKPVSRFILMDATQNIVDPPIPVIVDEEQGKEFPNPNDPAYIREVEANGTKRSMALAEVTLMLVVDVVEKIDDKWEIAKLPNDDSWLAELQWLGKRKRIDLSGYDLENEIDKVYIWKRFAVFGDNADFAKLMAQASGTDEKEIIKAMDTFQRDARGNSDNGNGSEESEGIS